MTEFIYFIGIIALFIVAVIILKKYGIIRRVSLPPISIRAILYDFAMPFVNFTEWVNERHHLHALSSALVIPFVCIAWILDWYDVRSMGTIMLMVLGGFACLAVHGVYEGWKQHKGKKYPNTEAYGEFAGKNIVPFSNRDVRTGMWAGVFWTYIATLIINHIILAIFPTL